MNTIPKIVINDIELDSETSRHVRNLIEGRFLQEMYAIVPFYKGAVKRNSPITQQDLDGLIMLTELCVKMNPDTFKDRPRILQHINIVDGKATLNFTLQEAIDNYNECYAAFKAMKPVL